MTWTVFLDRCASGDRRLFQALTSRDPTPWGRHWNRSLSRLADGPLYFPLALLPLALGHPQGLNFLLTVALGFLMELPAYKRIKRQTRRARPCHADPAFENLLPVPDRYSFPSGHTAGAFVLAAAVLAWFPGLLLSALLFAVSVGYSRVYNRLHFPADIAAGAVLGSLCGGLAVLFVQALNGGFA